MLIPKTQQWQNQRWQGGGDLVACALGDQFASVLPLAVVEKDRFEYISFACCDIDN